MRHSVLSDDGTRIFFSKVGTGPNLILVDGALCSSNVGPLGPLATLFASHFTVFHYDRRGRSGTPSEKPYSVQREVEDLQAVLSEAGGEAFAFGMSSGAVLVALASAQGVNFNKILLYEPPLIVGTDGAKSDVDHYAKLSELIAEGDLNQSIEYFMTRMVGMPLIIPRILRLLPLWKKLRSVAHTLHYDALITKEGSFSAATAANVRAPTMVMSGEKSAAFLQETSKSFAAAIPGAKHLVLKGQTHDMKPKVVEPWAREYFLG